MKFSDSVRAGAALLRHRTGDVLPVYLATTAASVVGQSILVLGGAVAFLSLYVTGRIRRVVELAQEVTMEELQDPEITPAEEALFEALADLVTPTVVLSLLAAVALAVVAVVVVRGLTAAAKVHTARALLAGDPPVVAGVRGARADARTFVAFVVLQAVLVLGVPAVGFGLSGLVVLAAPGPAGAALAVLLSLATLVLWLPALAVFYFGLLFTREAIVVEGVGLVDGIRRNVSFLLDQPVRAALYVFFEAGLLIAAGTAANVASFLGVSRVVAVASTLFVLPLLGLVKMAVYVEAAGEPAVGEDPAADEEPATTTTPAATDEDPAAADRSEWTRSDPGGTAPSGATGGDPTATAPSGATGSDPTATAPSGGTDEEPAASTPPDASGSDPAGTGPAATGDTAAEKRPAEGATARTVAVEGVPSGDRSGDGGVRAALAALRADLSAGFRDGLAELTRFVGGHPALFAVALAAFGFGVVAGYVTIEPLGIDITAGAGGGFGLFPLDAALQITANNWLVAIAQTYAGIALGLPAVVNLVFNGLVVGGLAGLGFDLPVFAALVVPHAVFEVPALAVSGALGFQLAVGAAAFARGTRSAEEFAADLRRAFRVLVGLLPVFVVAGFVEAFLTPVVGDLVRSAVGG